MGARMMSQCLTIPPLLSPTNSLLVFGTPSPPHIHDATRVLICPVHRLLRPSCSHLAAQAVDPSLPALHDHTVAFGVRALPPHPRSLDSGPSHARILHYVGHRSRRAPHEVSQPGGSRAPERSVFSRLQKTGTGKKAGYVVLRILT